MSFNKFVRKVVTQEYDQLIIVSQARVSTPSCGAACLVVLYVSGWHTLEYCHRIMDLHNISIGINFQLAFYWSLSILQFFDVKRKDFWEMFVHHLTTIALLCFSWTCNLTRCPAACDADDAVWGIQGICNDKAPSRCGALVLIVHDFADAFLEAAKLFHYAKWDNIPDKSILCTWDSLRWGWGSLKTTDIYKPPASSTPNFLNPQRLKVHVNMICC